jgi:hypothetical protein
MNTPTLFDPGPPDPRNDAAPLAGGAGVNGPNTSPDSRFARLPLMPPVRNDAPETSRVAAGRIAGHATTQRENVLNFIRGRGRDGATDPEIAAGCAIPIQSVNPRRGELAKLGLIVLSGDRRPTPSNCPARVWVAVEFAPPAEGVKP